MLFIGEDTPSIRTELIPEFSVPIYLVEIKLNVCENSFSILFVVLPIVFEPMNKFLTICCSSDHVKFSLGGQKGAFCQEFGDAHHAEVEAEELPDRMAPVVKKILLGRSTRLD